MKQKNAYAITMKKPSLTPHGALLQLALQGPAVHAQRPRGR